MTNPTPEDFPPGHYQDSAGRHWLHQVYDGSSYGAPERDTDQWLDPWGEIADPPLEELTRLYTLADARSTQPESEYEWGFKDVHGEGWECGSEQNAREQSSHSGGVVLIRRTRRRIIPAGPWEEVTE